MAATSAPAGAPDTGAPLIGAAAGRAARARVRRGAHGEFAPASDRPDPLDLLAAQARTRLQALVPLRHERMAVSAFAFFRGAAAVMAADLAATPHTGLRVQLCGDAHLANFGGFAAPDRRLVFDLNDFDETLPGPWEWDVKRLAASIAIAGRDRGFGSEQRAVATGAAVREYREAIGRFAAERHVEVWYARLDVEALLDRWRTRIPAKELRSFERGLAKARAKDSLRALDKLTDTTQGVPRIVADPPLIIPIEEVGELFGVPSQQIAVGVDELLGEHRRTVVGATAHLLQRYRYVHAAHKVVGVGSVGTRAWIALLVGGGEHDPVFLQLKEAQASVLEPYAGASEFATHGERVVRGQWLMQAASDIFLGWVSGVGIDGQQRDFYVRQLWDWKKSVDLEKISPHALAAYGQMCGWTLARAHARSGDPEAIAAYLGGSDRFDQALTRFAEAYADLNERDHAALVAALKPGGRFHVASAAAEPARG
ncbi:DUF2252 domain-containing protein [Conexibacter sp. JD483]|uniref:DUF2252 domain-containing protein n=1 Tax=unclassified Conexibacter TaxID=2627773 RepID=UPI00271DBECB|nr:MULTISPECIES: DUF2252 domain-containing protein [unclassified Conexibacter]MDO8188163.1 DUF2252 domain-containing protein [Conexibacter sp. CPCC 205706]MDO8202003.1 DUF2252 domain-containing protein [Conexibacter sp. CPCC 205762]MDR9372467.1 DUF2252 domain-containing protein [Conexibacter sp. JD483]